MELVNDLKEQREKIGVVGLGYVGLPLALALAQKFKVVGIDVKKERVEELQKGVDSTGEIDSLILQAAQLEYTFDTAEISRVKFIIVAVPTPVTEGNIPDLGLVEKATSMIAEQFSKGSIVVYESTVYPGVTEEICVPILEKISGFTCGVDFKVGYSPERINPGDKEHTITKVVKVVSGMDQESLEIISEVYGSITQVHRAPSIKVAEAAKVIENTQRDLNVALMNELTLIFHTLGISIYDVLDAASTKWNFLKFYPGLVGGHCIGVDPYYLTYKAQMLGYHPEVILSGRRINDSMGRWIVGEIIKKVSHSKKDITKLRILICGITFKENVSDVRNSKVVDIYEEFLAYGLRPLVYDPMASKEEVYKEYQIELCDLHDLSSCDVIILAVAHDYFKNISLLEWKDRLTKEDPLLVDIKRLFKKEEVESHTINYWSL
jgi:UDP-N-acetyl-D-galactosamine dehydrogenase